LSSGDIQSEDQMGKNYRKNYIQSDVDFAGQIEFQNSNRLISYFKQKSTAFYGLDCQYFDTKSIRHHSSGFSNVYALLKAFEKL